MGRPLAQPTMSTNIFVAMKEAETKAWDSLARYKFYMFGYHAGVWVNLNKLLAHPRPNPFSDTVKLANSHCSIGNANGCGARHKRPAASGPNDAT